ncbi:MAG TPA: helix-turn-helix domain-containing protein [Actinomycetes bacterium]|nr:helix-turn-helix domain-containing protein [Actinomycetes bacterium]
MLPVKPRERILSTATQLFSKEGISAVGINRIIAEARVAQMTPYRQFRSKDELVAATMEQWSTRWLHDLTAKLERYGDDAEGRYTGLWDALEEWFASEDFRGSFIANAAAELRSEPDHPGHAVIAEHRQTIRQLLEDLAKAAGAGDPAALAAQLQVLMDGAIALAAVDRRPAAARSARDLAVAALRSNAA